MSVLKYSLFFILILLIYSCNYSEKETIHAEQSIEDIIVESNVKTKNIGKIS